jgi:hypothetical protein
VSARFLARYCDKGRFSALFKINFCDNLSVKITLLASCHESLMSQPTIDP